MKWIFLIQILCIFQTSLAADDQRNKRLERINFFPDAKAFLIYEYSYERLNIETPRQTVMTDEVKNYTNLLKLGYAHRFARKAFSGLKLSFEEASENAVSYGIPLRQRFTGRGLKAPELFSLYRLRHQKGDTGVIDLYFAFSPGIGEREVGKENANRLNGRTVSQLIISHGLWENEWEFKSSLGGVYSDEGKEQNAFTNSSFKLGSYYALNFQFKTQYRLEPWLYLFGAVEIIYSSAETIQQESDGKREILSGTGSRFELGVKKPLGKWTVWELLYSLKRSEYFVKSDEDNLEGDLNQQSIKLRGITAF